MTAPSSSATTARCTRPLVQRIPGVRNIRFGPACLHTSDGAPAAVLPSSPTSYFGRHCLARSGAGKRRDGGGAGRRAELRPAAGVTIMICEFEDFPPIAPGPERRVPGPARDGCGRPVKSADRTLDVFELLAGRSRMGSPSRRSASDSGLARSSGATGLYGRCIRAGYLMENGGRRFHLGARLIQLGLNVVDRLELRAAARRPARAASSGRPRTTRRCFVIPRQGATCSTVDKVISDARNVRTDTASELAAAAALLEPREGFGSPPSTTSRCCKACRCHGSRACDRVFDR